MQKKIDQGFRHPYMETIDKQNIFVLWIETLSRDAYYRNKDGSRTIETLSRDAYYRNTKMGRVL